MSSEAITRNDLTAILNAILPTVLTNLTATSTPTADTISKFDASAHINSADMSAANISTFVSGLNTSGIHAADYIVDQGTSGIWTYRKWNSGIAECWGTHHWNITGWTKWGEIYYSTGSGDINYPSGLFKTSTAPTVIAVGRSNTDDTMLIADNDYPTPSSPLVATGFFLARPANGTSNSQDGYIHIHAMGVWK